MLRKLVRYRVKPDAVPAVRDAITEFVDAIAEYEPHTIYGAFVAEDGTSFVHAMAFPDGETEAHHSNAEHTKRFADMLLPNCEEEPLFTSIELVRSTKKGAGFLGMGGK